MLPASKPPENALHRSCFKPCRNALIVRSPHRWPTYASGKAMNNWMLSSTRAEKQPLGALGLLSANDRIAGIKASLIAIPSSRRIIYNPQGQHIII